MTSDQPDPAPAAAHNAVSQSQADRQWRAALVAAGYRVAPVMIPVHVAELLNPLGDKRAAEAAYREFLDAEPENAMALAGLACLLQQRGDVDELIEIRRRAFRVEALALGVPDQSVEATQRYFSACLGDGSPPASPPRAYLRAAFDQWAATYEAQWIDVQRYCGPELIGKVVAAEIAPRPWSLDVVDVGCGTGLLGGVLRPVSKRLEGVDLSSNMLQQAEAKSHYDELHQADCIDFLQARGEQFDVVVAAEVLNFLGDANALLSAAAYALRPQGTVILTTEPCDRQDGGWRLMGHRRYQHHASHLEAVARNAGLEVRGRQEVTLRHEFGEPLPGELFVLTRRG